MSRPLVLGLILIVPGLHACAGNPSRGAGLAPEFAAEVRSLTDCAQGIAIAEGFVASTSSQTQLERELPGESFYSKELLWLNARRDGDTLRMDAHIQNTRDGARRTAPASQSAAAQRVLERIRIECVIAVAAAGAS